MKKDKKNNNRSYNVLVTGGAGFLGSHVADAITYSGHNVTIFDIVESPFLRDNQRMIVGDILNLKELDKAMDGIDIVFHLAALSNIDLADDKPYDTMEINVLGTTNLLSSAKLYNIKRVIFASSIYVNSRTGSFYRVSKHACELLLEAYYERYGLSYSILRFGTLYGPRADETNSINRYLKEAINKGEINYYGTGDEVREFIHVLDAARICVEVINRKYNGETLILTGHQQMKLRELLSVINEILGNRIKIIYHKNKSRAHYNQTPYSYIPNVGKKIISKTYCDIGQSLVEILDELNPNENNNIIEI